MPPLVQGQVLGVHILNPGEIDEAAKLLKTDANRDEWVYVTVPLSLDDLSKKNEWQDAFNHARQEKINPIVRLVSRFDTERNAWAIPTRADIIAAFDFLNQLDWPRSEKLIIAFNEPNHASEWGGTINPASYAEILDFTVNWAHTENNGYRVLPAAMDLAAPDGPDTWEAFHYLREMISSVPQVFDQIDYWNSHSYPNPAFSSPPTSDGQNSLRGFTYELAWLKEETDRDLSVFITETGWQENQRTRDRLDDYYAYAREHIWSDERVIAITPFVLHGDPGPFSGFTFIDKRIIKYSQGNNGYQEKQRSTYHPGSLIHCHF